MTGAKVRDSWVDSDTTAVLPDLQGAGKNPTMRA